MNKKPVPPLQSSPAVLSSRPRVLIADDHELVARGIEKVLGEDAEIVGVVANGQELLSAALRLRPHVVIVDIAMPFLNGLDAALRLRGSLPDVKLLFITQYTDRQYVEAAFRVGGHAYVLKQSAAKEVCEAMKAILKGEYFVSSLLRKDLPPLTKLRQNPAEFFGSQLTSRQREVLQMVAEGKTAKEIAQILNISHKTVEFHKSGIMELLGLKTIAELTRYALEHRLIPTQGTSGS